MNDTEWLLSFDSSGQKIFKLGFSSLREWWVTLKKVQKGRCKLDELVLMWSVFLINFPWQNQTWHLKKRMRRRLKFTWTSNSFPWLRWFKKKIPTCEVLTIFDNRFHRNIFHLRVFGYFISQKASLCSFTKMTWLVVRLQMFKALCVCAFQSYF